MKKNSKITPSKTKAAATAEKGKKNGLPVELVSPEDAPQKKSAPAKAATGKTRGRATASPAVSPGTPKSAGYAGKTKKKAAPLALEPDDDSRSSATVLDVDELENERDTDELDMESPDREDALLASPLDDDDDDEPGLASENSQGRGVPAPSSSRVPAVGVRDSLHLYLREVGRFPMLKPEEEHELAVRVRDHNDADAAFRLVSSHLRLVVRIAMDFQRRWMQNVLDLVQEGNVGLMRAVNKFDPDKGIKFSYYASFWIKAYILKFIMDNWRMVKIGTTQVQRKLFYNLNRERQKLIMQGYDPDAAMLSERLGVTEEQINEMDQRLASTDMSLNAQVGEESGGATRMDFLPALGPGIEDSLASTQIAGIVRSKLKTIMPKLNEKEQYILHNRLLSDEPMTLREIGERYNITRERVRQLEARLVEKIGQHIKNDIEDFSDHWIQS